ncbi:hypothetical protein [Mesorhizobium sp.]|uniref:hypothetical protein n=1 Tax=Mesorhizobium sp. TaxID=1871066 RepID=UPI001207E8E6|nr:hypothetical protein [Mesorhizobium sp.]TIS34353.1 MAG: hypothetical protein E5W95_30720 [Mesorhizobium sp.]
MHFQTVQNSSIVIFQRRVVTATKQIRMPAFRNGSCVPRQPKHLHLPALKQTGIRSPLTMPNTLNDPLSDQSDPSSVDLSTALATAPKSNSAKLGNWDTAEISFRS